MARIALVFLALLSSWPLIGFANPIPLPLGPFRGVEQKRLENGEREIQVTGPAPHFWSAPVPEAFDPDVHTVLAFEYFSTTGVKGVSIRFQLPDATMSFAATADIPLSETWQPFAIDLSGASPALTRGKAKQRFHFALRHQPGSEIRLRKVVLRSPTAEEIRVREGQEEARRKKETDAAAIRSYLASQQDSEIREIVVGKEVVTIVGRASEPALLRELRPVHASHQVIPDPPIARELSGDFRIEVPRFLPPHQRDRALSRWRLERAEGGSLSASRWADRVESDVTRKLERLESASQKGLGGLPDLASPDHEIFELGIHHGTINVVLNALLSNKPRKGWEKLTIEGKPYWLNRNFLDRRMKTVRQLREQGIIVSAILLVANQSESALVHPEAESRGKFAMPNLRTPQGAGYYRAILHVLANHFTMPATRVSNWIVHNEIDQAGTWTNMGDQPQEVYLETYHRSARLVYHTMRLRDPHARVFISLTHHWTKQSAGQGTYTVRDLLEQFNDFGQVEGDYEWGVAYHPYPRDLRNPDSWKDEGATMNFDTPYITPRNFEVLPFYLQQDRFLHEGKPRGILFSEQGWNSPTLSEEDQRRQVTGMISFFRRLPEFPVIEAFHLHRYQDMPDQEGGLRLGIIDENGNRKLGWDAYRTLHTPEGWYFEAMADEWIRGDESGEEDGKKD